MSWHADPRIQLAEANRLVDLAIKEGEFSLWYCEKHDSLFEMSWFMDRPITNWICMECDFVFIGNV